MNQPSGLLAPLWLAFCSVMCVQGCMLIVQSLGGGWRSFVVDSLAREVILY
jgi:hypothetical protein